MRALVACDSEFGNTKRIAMAMGEALGSSDAVEVMRVCEVKIEHLKEHDLLIVGSSTQQFGQTQATSDFLKQIPNDGLQGVRIAAFDTRLTDEEIEETAVLSFFIRIFGYAAKPIGDELKKKRGELVTSPEGFYVEGVKGPLVEGKLERAEAWARQIIAIQ